MNKIIDIGNVVGMIALVLFLLLIIECFIKLLS